MTTWIRWFDDVGINDVPVVRGKNASLGGMRQALTPLGIRTRDGFATTADAYREFLSAAGLERVIGDVHSGRADLKRLRAAGSRVRSSIPAAESTAPVVRERQRPTAAGRIGPARTATWPCVAGRPI